MALFIGCLQTLYLSALGGCPVHQNRSHNKFLAAEDLAVSHHVKLSFRKRFHRQQHFPVNL
jgi:hypothetical protein